MDDSAKICFICKRPDDNPLDLGEFNEIENVHVHYFCLLLSKLLPQRGRDTEGVLGFLWPDIVACEKMAKKRRCFYCKKMSASLWCDKPLCKRFYHVACGMQNNCLFEFHDGHESFCDRHHGIEENGHYIHQDAEPCLTCLEPLGKYNPVTSIPSCCNKAWFHRDCMKKAALTSGLELHCPVCGHGKESYQAFIKTRGIYVPHTDAAWEKTHGAYNSLLFRYNRCDFDPCVCPKGRQFDKGPWKILTCERCGSNGVHSKCLLPAQQTDAYVCKSCDSQQPESAGINGDVSTSAALQTQSASQVSPVQLNRIEAVLIPEIEQDINGNVTKSTAVPADQVLQDPLAIESGGNTSIPDTTTPNNLDELNGEPPATVDKSVDAVVNRFDYNECVWTIKRNKECERNMWCLVTKNGRKVNESRSLDKTRKKWYLWRMERYFRSPYARKSSGRDSHKHYDNDSD